MTRSPLVLLPEADFLCLEDVGVASLLGSRAAETRKRDRTDDSAEATEVELGEDLEDGDVVAVEVVQGEVADGGAGDDDADAGVGDLFDDLRRGVRPRRWTKGGGSEGSEETHLLELLLLAASEVQHLIRVLEENGALCFCLRDIDAGGVDGDLGILDLLDGACDA